MKRVSIISIITTVLVLSDPLLPVEAGLKKFFKAVTRDMTIYLSTLPIPFLLAKLLVFFIFFLLSYLKIS